MPSIGQLQQPQARRAQRYSLLAQTMVNPEVRRAMIAETAFFRAQRRGFEPGHELEDWLAAEAEVDTALTIGLLPTGG